MTRKECLDKAAECVLKDRQNSHGEPEDSFGMIAGLWSVYLDTCVSAHDVAAMMALLKIARFRHNPGHLDNAVDCAGYAACMAETATAWKDLERKVRGRGPEIVSRIANEVAAAWEESLFPHYKPGDAVQFRNHVGVKDWTDAVYEGAHPSGTGHIVYTAGFGKIAVDSDNLRHAPKPVFTPEDSHFDEARMRESMPGIVPQDGPSDLDGEPAIYGAHIE